MRPMGSCSLGRLDVAHEAGQLDGPEAALGIPVDRDRILNQRLAGHQLEAVAGRHGERLQRVGGREHRRRTCCLAGRRAARIARRVAAATRRRRTRRPRWPTRRCGILITGMGRSRARAGARMPDRIQLRMHTERRDVHRPQRQPAVGDLQAGETGRVARVEIAVAASIASCQSDRQHAQTTIVVMAVALDMRMPSSAIIARSCSSATGPSLHRSSPVSTTGGLARGAWPAGRRWRCPSRCPCSSCGWRRRNPGRARAARRRRRRRTRRR